MRIFKCSACGHRMRLRGNMCGRCYQRKPVLLSPLFIKTLVFASVMGLCGAVTLTALLRHL